MLHLKLNQINTTNNVYNGSPSQMLASIEVESNLFREITAVDMSIRNFALPELSDKLKLSILNEKWVSINNQCVVLEIKKMPGCKN